MVSGNCRYTGVAKTYRGTNCFFTESQYTDIPVISPTPSQGHSKQQNKQGNKNIPPLNKQGKALLGNCSVTDESNRF